jgi:hypothetical protein
LLSVELAWNKGYDLITKASTGYLSCIAKATVQGDIVVSRLNGFRGPANAIIQRRFFFGPPPQTHVPTVPVIQPSSGTIVIRTWTKEASNTAGTPGGHSYVEERDSRNVQVHAVDISGVLTGGLKAATLLASDPADTTLIDNSGDLIVGINRPPFGNLSTVVNKANSLGIITQSVATSLVDSKAEAHGRIIYGLPDSNPLFLQPQSYLLVACEIEKWRFGLYVMTLIYAQVPSLT